VQIMGRISTSFPVVSEALRWPDPPHKENVYNRGVPASQRAPESGTGDTILGNELSDTGFVCLFYPPKRQDRFWRRSNLLLNKHHGLFPCG